MGAIADFLKSGQSMPAAKTGAIGEYLQEQEAAKHVESPRINGDYNKLFGTASNPNQLQADTAQMNQIVATARQLPKVQPKAQPKGAIQSGLDTFNAYSHAIQDPLVNSLTLGGANLAKQAGGYLGDKVGQLTGATPAEIAAGHQRQAQYDAQQQQLVPETARNVLGAVGNVAGSIGAFGGLTKAVGQPLAKLAGKAGLGKLGQAMVSNGATMGAYEGINSLTQGNGLAESAKRAGQGVALGAFAGPLGELASKGVSKGIGALQPLADRYLPKAAANLLPAAAHYAGNAASGAVTGLGFSYGGNLMNGQPLNNSEAGKNAVALAALSALTGGRYRTPLPEPIKGPEFSGNASFGPNLKPDPNAWTVDATGNVRTPQTPIALLPAGKSVKFNRYTMQPFLNQRAEQLQNVYDQGVVDMQNQYGHWDIHPPDVQPTAQKAGVNLENMFNSLQRSENIPTTSEMLNNLAPQGRMARVVGLKDIPTLKKPEPLDYYGVKGQAVMQNKGIRRVQPIPKANIPEPLPQANTGANGGVVDTSNRLVPANQRGKFNTFDWMHKIYTKTVDTNHPLNRLTTKGDYGTESIKVMANNAKNAPTIAEHIVNDTLVDRAGKAIGEGYKKVIGRVPKKDLPAFNEYLLHKHNVARMSLETPKPVFGNNVTAEMSAQKVAQLEAEHPEFAKASTELNKFMQTFSKAWGVDSGRTSADLMSMLNQKYPDYVPVYRAEDPSYVSMAKQGNLGTGNFIKNADGGNSKIIYPTNSIPLMIDKTVKAARQNEVYQTILNAVKRNPAEMRKWGISITKTGKDTLEELSKIHGIEDMANFEQLHSDPKGGNVLTVMVQGQPVSLRINNPDLFKSLVDLKTGHISGTFESLARKTTAPVKNLITGDNPLFGVFNMARDIPTYAVNSTENNPLKAIGNYLGATKDVMTNSPTFQEYKGLGGGGGNYFAEDVKGNLGKANIFRRFNNAIETAPRLAEYKGTVNRGGGGYASKQQGIYNANEVTTNFGRYGDLTKSADSGVMYLNAATQGMDKLVRQFVNHPIATILKGATVITAPALILNHINKDNPHYNALDNRTKDSYFLFPNYSDLDAKGVPKTFYRLPKSRELGVLFGSLAERTLRSMAGEKGSFNGFGDTVSTNFAPQNPLTQHFLAPLIYNIPINKDFAGRAIVPRTLQDGRSPRYQYDEQTSEIAKKIGDVVNLSPKQIDYLIKSYTGWIGQLALPATVKANMQKGDILQNTAGIIGKKFTADPQYNNSTVDDFYNNYDKLKELAANKNVVENIPSKLVTKEERARNAYLKASKEMSALTKQIKIADQKGDQVEVQKLTGQRISKAQAANNMLKQWGIELN